MYYQSPHQTPEDDLVDERWENNLVFHPSTSSLKEQPIKTAFNNLKISYNGGSKQASSPQVSGKKQHGYHGLSTAFFREDVSCDEDKDYFQYITPTIVVDLATPVTTPPVSEKEESYCELLEPATRAEVNKGHEDFLVQSSNDTPPNECVIELKQREIEKDTNDVHTPLTYKQPDSIKDYHLDLVRHYVDIVLRKTDPGIVPPEVLQALPDVYVTYIESIRKAVSSD